MAGLLRGICIPRYFYDARPPDIQYISHGKLLLFLDNVDLNLYLNKNQLCLLDLKGTEITQNPKVFGIQPNNQGTSRQSGCLHIPRLG